MNEKKLKKIIDEYIKVVGSEELFEEMLKSQLYWEKEKEKFRRRKKK